MNLVDLLKVIPFYNASSPLDGVEIHSIEMDSRKVEKGSLFVCIEGFTVDGHDYAKEAVNRGAAAIISNRALQGIEDVPVVIMEDTNRAMALLANKFFDYPTHAFSLIGITGTNGKTTVTYLLEEIFRHMNQKTGVIGTIQAKIGEEVYPVANTTPDALSLQKLFDQMREQKVEKAIMEVSSHALDLGRVHGSDYDIAIFTNLSQDHLDYHKDMDDYLRAKSLLFSQLGNAYDSGRPKYAVINADDSSCDLLVKSTAQPVLTYSCEKEATVMAKNIVLDPTFTAFDLVTPNGSVSIRSRLIGMFNIYNMLAAATAAVAQSVPLAVLKEAFERIAGVDGRFQPVLAGQDFAVIVDYAHTPDSLENVLATSREFARKKLYVVVGCGGDRDRSKRPLMADIAVKYGDHAIFTSDNPRTEDPQLILKDMSENMKETDRSFEVIEDRKAAIQQAIQYAEKDDIILIAGKGHETYQIIGTTKYDFDDREVARIAIESKEK